MSPGFPRDRRVTRGPDLQRVLKEGKRIRTKYFDVRICASPLGYSLGRVGIIVPKAKHTAVDRNKLKRRLKELSQGKLLPIGNERDMVLIARADTYRATFEMLRHEVDQLAAVLQSSELNTK